MSELQIPKKRKTQGLTFSSVSQKPTEENVSETSQYIDDGYRFQHSKDPEDSIGSGASSPKTIKTRFLLLSDTHGASRLLEQYPIRIFDVVLHCGDLTEISSLPEYKRSINLRSRIPAELKLVIPGNHDLALDDELWEQYDSTFSE